MDKQEPQSVSSNNLGELSTLQFGSDYKIYYYKNPIILNKQYNEDIIPGVYEGGFQLWECEIQLLKKMFQQQQLTKIFNYKSVCQIGCGHGLLAIGAALLGASKIIFQDYNVNVINQLTKPTRQINISNHNNTTLSTNSNVQNVLKNKSHKICDCKIQYIWGDWQQLKPRCEQERYDIILGSEVIYRQQNYDKLIKYIKNNLKHNGRCIMANKSYYFGVGGNMVGFKQRLQESDLLWRTLYKIVPKSGGNRKQIIQITFSNHSQ